MKTTIESKLIVKDTRIFLENSVLAIEATEIDKAKEVGNYTISHKTTDEEIAEIYIFVLPSSRACDYIVTINRSRFDMDFLAMFTNAIGAVIKDFRSKIIK